MHVTRSERGQLSEAGAADDLINLNSRAWLLRLCTRLSRDLDGAEDLAQETLIEAWRHWDRLRDPNQINPWLAGIARNVYRRRTRQRAREAARILPPKRCLCGGDPLGQVPDEDALAFQVELERQELATLLDRALKLLPLETRDLLIQHYIDESSHAEIAERLGLSEGTLAVRLHRGRLALRSVLVENMADELAASGIIMPDDAYWHPAPLWCRYCGTHKLLSRVDSGGMLILRCPSCCRMQDEAHSEAQLPESFRSIGGYL